MRWNDYTPFIVKHFHLIVFPEVILPGAACGCRISAATEEWADVGTILDPAVLLQAIIDQARAEVLTTTAKSMGWSVR